jgi:hypothetical protein
VIVILAIRLLVLATSSATLAQPQIQALRRAERLGIKFGKSGVIVDVEAQHGLVALSEDGVEDTFGDIDPNSVRLDHGRVHLVIV